MFIFSSSNEAAKMDMTPGQIPILFYVEHS